MTKEKGRDRHRVEDVEYVTKLRNLRHFVYVCYMKCHKVNINSKECGEDDLATILD
eukprot:m.8763 g.8763  ORF g.8763 m.8763 type:complete len:56 (-) comp7125_c0_seq1:33-200(-)